MIPPQRTTPSPPTLRCFIVLVMTASQNHDDTDFDASPSLGIAARAMAAARPGTGAVGYLQGMNP